MLHPRLADFDLCLIEAHTFFPLLEYVNSFPIKAIVVFRFDINGIGKILPFCLFVCLHSLGMKSTSRK